MRTTHIFASVSSWALCTCRYNGGDSAVISSLRGGMMLGAMRLWWSCYVMSCHVISCHALSCLWAHDEVETLITYFDYLLLPFLSTL